jgi:signal peptidase II
MDFLQKRKKYIVITLGVFSINYAADRLTKILASAFLMDKGVITHLRGLFVLYYVENEGAFLSMGTNWNPYIKYCVLLVIPVAVCAGGLVYLMVRESKMYRVILLSCIFGGGIGNLTDRLFNDFKVIDFLNFGIGGFRTGVLNVADLSVTFGAVLFVLFELLSGKEKKPAH